MKIHIITRLIFGQFQEESVQKTGQRRQLNRDHIILYSITIIIKIKVHPQINIILHKNISNKQTCWSATAGCELDAIGFRWDVVGDGVLGEPTDVTTTVGDLIEGLWTLPRSKGAKSWPWDLHWQTNVDYLTRVLYHVRWRKCTLGGIKRLSSSKMYIRRY